jgi:hypothetical protein
VDALRTLSENGDGSEAAFRMRAWHYQVLALIMQSSEEVNSPVARLRTTVVGDIPPPYEPS